MNETQQSAVRAWYAAYVDRFKVDGSLHPHLQLKLDHGARVAGEAGDLATDLGWPERDVRTAETLGLLHDIGRFSQFAEFGTFNDRESVDHGERGFEVLVDEDPLARCREVDRGRVLDGVRCHNSETLPSDMGDDSLSFARLVRDADKLDIYYVVHHGIVTGELNEDNNFMGDVDPERGPSEEVLGYLRRRRMVPNTAVRSLADCLLSQVGWVYDVNYSATMRRLRERQLLERLRNHLPPDAAVSEVFALAAEFRDRALVVRPEVGA